MQGDNFYYTEVFKKIANRQKVLLNLGTSEYGVTYTQSMVILFLFETQKFHGDDHEIS